MKNLAIAFLLLTYTSSQVGSILIFYYKPVIHAISIYRQQRRMRDEQHPTREMVISGSVYQQSLHEEGEILLKGVLYDIKQVIYKDGMVHLQLLEDKNESKWMKTFAAFVHDLHKQDRSQKHSQLIWNWLFKIYPCQASFNFGLTTLDAMQIKFPKIQEHTSSIFLSSPGQPPEL